VVAGTVRHQWKRIRETEDQARSEGSWMSPEQRRGMMGHDTANWYSVSVILFFRLRSGPAKQIRAMENVYLVKARSEKDARRYGEECGRAEAIENGVELDGKPADLVFGGVRKVVSCASNPKRRGQSEVFRMHNGVEATYSTFIVQGEKELSKLLRGDPVAVTYEE